MRKALVLFLLTIPLLATAADFTPVQRLKSFPIPPGENVKTDLDLDQQPDFEFIKAHPDLVFADPFLFQRQAHKSIPEHAFEYFLSDKAARDIYLFYKLYLNQESRKSDAERAKLFYSARSWVSFDVKNEADVPRHEDAAKAVYYKMEAAGAQGMTIDILVFNKGEGGKTLVYLTAFDKGNL